MEITEQLWNCLKGNTLNGVLRLLESAEKLLSNDGDVSICAGLHTYAVEEYGKLVLLSEYVPMNGKVDLNERQLFVSHDSKFKAAISKLPDECKHIGIDYGVGHFPKGYFPKGYWPDESSVVADFKSRMAIFYCGLGESKKAIEPVPGVGRPSLKKAIEKLKTIAFGFETT